MDYELSEKSSFLNTPKELGGAGLQLPPAAICLSTMLATFKDSRKDNIIIRIGYLAKCLGCSRRHIFSGLKTLKEQGVWTCERVDYWKNAYAPGPTLLTVNPPTRAKPKQADSDKTDGDSQHQADNTISQDTEKKTGGTKTIKKSINQRAEELAEKLEKTEAFKFHMRESHASLMEAIKKLLKEPYESGYVEKPVKKPWEDRGADEEEEEEEKGKTNAERFDDFEKQLLTGLDTWTKKWKHDDWKYAPGYLSKWLYDKKYLEKVTVPPVEVGFGCENTTIEII